MTSSRSHARRLFLSILLVLLAATALTVSGCKKDEASSSESADEKKGSSTSGKPGTPVAVASGVAAEPQPIGDTDAQKKLLIEGPGRIDTAIALRMMGDKPPQRGAIRPGPLQRSGLKDAILGAVPPHFVALYNDALASVGGVDPFEAIDTMLFWSNTAEFEDLDHLGLVLVTRGDALARVALPMAELLSKDDDDDDAGKPITEGFAVLSGPLDSATLRQLADATAALPTAADRPVTREDLADDRILLARPHKRGGTSFLYLWSDGVVIGSSAQTGDALEIARSGAASFVRQVEAARAGSGGELGEDVVLAVNVTKDGQTIDVSLVVDDAVVLDLRLPREVVGEKAISGFKLIPKMDDDDLRGMLDSQGVPAELVDVSILTLKTLEVDDDKESLGLRLSPSVADIKSALPKAR